VLIEPKVFGDDRGFFYESFNRKLFAEGTGVDPDFVQDNHSRSSRGVLRGCTTRSSNHGETGRVCRDGYFDVAVDLRRPRRLSPMGRNGIVRRQQAHAVGAARIRARLRHALGLGGIPFTRPPTTTRRRMSGSILWNDPQIGIRWPIDFEPGTGKKTSRGVVRDAEVIA